ncbi:MAG: DUF3048 domain-containing protein [Bacillota bacterium]|nr:DUF3048 domain-containing protein [Bacillota bacterium]
MEAIFLSARVRRHPDRHVFLVLVVLMSVAAVACRPQPVVTPVDPEPEPPVPPPPVLCGLCGAVVPPETALYRRPLLVLLDNHSAARPQAGIPAACLVFETLAEGGITRLAPVFAHAAPERIGPVRSARPYFLDLALGLDAFIAHAGQSPEAAADIENLKVASLNAFGFDDHYWRESARKAPHNLYTSDERLRAAAVKARLTLTRDAAAVRWPVDVGAAPAAELPAAPGLRVVWPFSSTGHVTVFRWRAAAEGEEYGRYERSVNDKPHLDEESGEILGGRNVAVLFAKMWRIAGDPEGRLDANFTGAGRAIVASDGRLIEAKWRKSTRASALELVDQNGERLELPPGQTWILIVPEQTVVEVLAP